jgi:hypothetical protein
LWTKHPQPSFSSLKNTVFHAEKSRYVTSHNQTATKKQSKIKLQSKTHPEKLWCGKPPQPQVKNKKIRLPKPTGEVEDTDAATVILQTQLHQSEQNKKSQRKNSTK